MKIDEAVKTLREAGAVVLMPGAAFFLQCKDVAQVFGFKSGDWTKNHLDEFPNACRAPGGGVHGGEILVPIEDVEALAARLPKVAVLQKKDAPTWVKSARKKPLKANMFSSFEGESVDFKSAKTVSIC